MIKDPRINKGNFHGTEVGCTRLDSPVTSVEANQEKELEETFLVVCSCSPHFKILSSMTMCSILSAQVNFKIPRDAPCLSITHYNSDRGGGVDRLCGFPEIPKWLIVFRINRLIHNVFRDVTFYIRNIHLCKCRLFVNT